MKRKKFNTKMVTLLQMIFCLLLAIIIWFVVQYANMQNSDDEAEAYEPSSSLASAWSCDEES